MPTEKELAKRRHDTKTYTQNLLNDYESMNLSRFQAFVNGLRLIEPNNKTFIDLYRSSHPECSGKSDIQVFNIIKGIQEEQKRKLTNAANNLAELKNKISEYQRTTSNVRDDKSINEANLWKDIANLSQSIMDDCKDFMENQMFEVKSEMVDNLNWFAGITNVHFKAPVEGSLKFSNDEKKAAEKDNRFIKVTTKAEVVQKSDGFFTALKKKASNRLSGTEDMSRYDLFPHNPSTEDISQGGVGDCYMLTAMAALAKHSPDSIRNCMQDKDNSITVRFYGHEGSRFGPLKPVYVNIPKEIGTSFMNLLDTGSARQGSEGAMWAAMMEYAYAASGLHVNPEGVIKTEEEMTQIRQEYNTTEKMLKSIEGGNAAKFTECLLGPAANISSVRSFTSAGKKLDIQTIKDALDKEMVISCSVHAKFPQNPKTGDKTLPETVGNNIYTCHAYSILGFNEETQKLKIKNPHNSTEVNGAEFEMSVEEFQNTFTDVDFAVVPDVYTMKDEKTVKDNFKDLAGKLTDGFTKQGFPFESWFNSSQYEKFKTSMKNFAKSLKSETATVSQLKNQLKDAADRAQEYINYTKGKELNERRENRAEIAKSVIALNKMLQQDELANPSKSFNNVLKGLIAEKLSKGLENSLGHKMDPAKIVASSAFKDLIKDEKSLFDKALNTTGKKIADFFQQKMKAAGHEIKQEEPNKEAKGANIGAI